MHRFLVWVAASWAIGSTAWVSAGCAQEDAARAHYERGVGLFDEGQYEAALAEFEAAYDASGRRSILFNVGQIHARLGNAVEAVATLEEYIAAEGAAITVERRAQVDSELAIQRARIGHLALRCEVTGAVVRIDARDRGVVPLEAPVPLSAGTHTVEVIAAGHSTYAQSFRLAGGETRELTAELPVLTSAAGDVSPPLPVLTVVGASVAAAGLVSWVTFGTWTLLEDDRLKRECAPICSSDDTATLAITRVVSDVGAGVTAVGAVLLVVGLVLELDSPRTPQADSARARLSPSGVVLTW